MTGQFKDTDQLVKDIQIIKGLLIEADKKPLLEYWAFLTWGIFILIGSVVHFCLQLWFNFSAIKLFLRVWVPVILLGFILEFLAWLVRKKKEAIPFVSQIYLKTLWGFCILTLNLLAVVGVFIFVEGLHYLPVLILVSVSICYTFLAILSQIDLFFPAGFLCLSGLIFLLLDIHGRSVPLLTGIIVALAFFLGGLITWAGERKEENKKHE